MRLLLCTLFVFVFGCTGTNESSTPDNLPLQDQTNAPETIVVTSPDFVADGEIDLKHAFNQFGCVGENIAPVLEWNDVPEGTQSFVVIAHDPDAPTGVGFFHWIVTDIPKETRKLSTSIPIGSREHETDYGAVGYGGPCPPEGRNHRYVFSVYALGTPSLQLPANASGALTRFMLLQHTIAVGRLTGTFSR